MSTRARSTKGKARNQTAPQDVEVFIHAFLQDSEWQEIIKRKILAGKAPDLEVLFWDCAFGPPEGEEVNEHLMEEVVAEIRRVLVEEKGPAGVLSAWREC